MLLLLLLLMYRGEMYKKVGESTNWDRLFQTLLIGRSHSTALRSTTHHHHHHHHHITRGVFVMRAANPMTATTIKPSNGGKRKETDDTMVDKTNEEKRLKVTKRKKKVTVTSLRTTATPSADGDEGNTSVMILNTSDHSGEKSSDDVVLSQPLASSTPEKKNTLGFLLR